MNELPFSSIPPISVFRVVGSFLSSRMILLAAGMLMMIHSAQAISYQSAVVSGSWEDPASWTPAGIPGAGDDVLILAGTTILLPAGNPAHACAQLTIEGHLILGGGNFTVSGTTVIQGSLMDATPAGHNIFSGKVMIAGTGSFHTLAVKNRSHLLFEGGIDMTGSTCQIGAATFITQNQQITGDQPLSFEDSVGLGAGITLYNQHTGGLILEQGSSLFGSSGTSRWINQGLMIVRADSLAMVQGQVDVGSDDNIVRYEGIGAVQYIMATAYWNLEVANDHLSGSYALLTGLTSVDVELTVESGSRLSVSVHDLMVGGTGRIAGSLHDDAWAGQTIFLTDLDLSGGVIEGNGTNYGLMDVWRHLIVTSDDAILREVLLTVSGEADISAGGKLQVTHHEGAKAFQQLRIAPASACEITADHPDVNFFVRDSLVNEGTFSALSGTYVLEGHVRNAAGATFDVSATAGNCYLRNGLTNWGTCDLAGGTFWMQGEMLGGSGVTFAGQCYVIWDEMLINKNTGGLTFTQHLDGQGGNATFRNDALLIYSPADNTIPMSTAGTLDACSTPGNTVVYGSSYDYQDIYPGCYQHLQWANGLEKRLLDGDIEIKGDFTHETDQGSTGKIFLTGASNQLLSGDGRLYVLTADKAAGDVILGSDLHIEDTLQVKNGMILTFSFSAILGDTATLDELPTAYVEGAVEVLRWVGGAVANDFGGIGFTMIPSAGNDPGFTAVTRNTGSAVGSGFINRYFEIQPANNANLGAAVLFEYFDADLGPHLPLLLNLYTAGPVAATHTTVTVQGDGSGSIASLPTFHSFTWLTAGSPGPLPVEWLYVEAAVQSAGVLLEWATATEVNTDYFEVERSSDGRIFAPIQRVAAAGNAPDMRSYDYLDTDRVALGETERYYRLRQVDLDGQHTYSRLVRVALASDPAQAMHAYPSPFSSRLWLELNPARSGNADIWITDVAGRRLFEQQEMLTFGNMRLEINTTSLVSGIYFVHVAMEGAIFTAKVRKE